MTQLLSTYSSFLKERGSFLGLDIILTKRNGPEGYRRDSTILLLSHYYYSGSLKKLRQELGGRLCVPAALLKMGQSSFDKGKIIEKLGVQHSAVQDLSFRPCFYNLQTT